MPVCLARRALHAAATDPGHAIQALAEQHDAALFDALLEQTQVHTRQGWQTLSDPALPHPLTLRGLIALAPAGSVRASALREALTDLLITGDARANAIGRLDYLDKLPRLRRLRVVDCAALVGWDALVGHPTLSALELVRCGSDLADLKRLVQARPCALSIQGIHPLAPALPEGLGDQPVADLGGACASAAPEGRALPPDLRPALQQLRSLLRSGDTDQLQQALELLCALDDPALYGALLRGCGVTVPEDGQLPQLRLGGSLRVGGGPRAAARMRWAMLRMLARAPSSQPAAALRQVTALRLDSPVVDMADLATVFPRLERLALRRTKTWRHPEALGTLAALRELTLVNCVPPEGLAYPAGLRHLEVSGDPRLTDLAGLPGLTSLALVQVDALASLDGLPPSVRSLSISRARALEDISALSGCARLAALTLRACPALGSLDGLSEHHHLQRLTIEGCRGVRSLAPLRGCDALETVTLADLMVTDLDGLQDATGLYAVTLALPRLQSLHAICEAPLLVLRTARPPPAPITADASTG